jgi:hypothetical protein
MPIKEIFAAAGTETIMEVGGAAPLSELTKVFGNVISALLGLAGIILLIMIIVGGLSLLTSGGDPGKAAAAKNTLTHAIGGVVLVAFAYLILRAISAVTGADILDFNVWLAL